MFPRLVILLLAVSPMLAQPAAAHPSSPDIAHATSQGVLATALGLVDDAGRPAGWLHVYIHEDGLAVTTTGSYVGPWFSAQLKIWGEEEVRARGALAAGTVEVDPVTGLRISAELGPLGALDLTAAEPTPVASNAGCAGYYGSSSGPPEPHEHWWFASVARTGTYGAVAQGLLGSYRVEAETIYFAQSGVGKIQVDVPVVAPPPLCVA